MDPNLVNTSAKVQIPHQLGQKFPPLLEALRQSTAATGLKAPQYILLAILSTPLILSFAPGSLLRRALYPVQLCLVLCAFLAPLPANAPQADLYNLGLLIGGYTARILDRVYLHAPEKTFLRKGIDDNSRSGGGPETYGFWGKVAWATELIFAQRGVGWNWQVGGMPRPEYYAGERRAFVRSRVVKTLLTFFLIHMVSVGAGVILRYEGDDSSVLGAVTHNSLFLRFFITVGWLTVIYGHITLPENLLAITLVSTCLWGRWSDPAQWPPLFGDISDSYTLRRCWGKFWHANLRRITNAPGVWLMDTFPNLRKAKNMPVRLLRRYGLLFLAFAVSGIVHASGSFIVTRDRPQAEGGISDGGAAAYFLAQPLAILIEDLVLNMLGVEDDGKPSKVQRVVGYVYVAAFWLWCFPTLKVMPLADAHGLGDARGEMLGAVRACKELAEAMPFNPAKSLMEYIF